MNVYSLTTDCDNYQTLELIDEENDWELMYEFDGTAIGSKWRPLPVQVYEDDLTTQRPPSDCPSLFAGIPVLSLQAVKVLKPILDGNGELLPLDFEGGTYFILNVTRVIDALDEQKSEIIRFPDGKKVMDIKRYTFIGSRLKGVDIFKLPQRPLGGVFVTDRFMQTVRQAGLVGFIFYWLWASDQVSSSPPIQTTTLQ